MVAGITEVETNSSREIMDLLQQGNSRRAQHATAANEVSSRSHAVLQVNHNILLAFFLSFFYK